MGRSPKDSRSKVDKYDRIRNRTIAFRLSEAEYTAVELKAGLCGYRWKQDYILDAILNNSVTATANPMILVQFRRQLRQISEQLEHSSLTDEERDELHISINIMREILEAFAYERDLNGEGR